MKDGEKSLAKIFDIMEYVGNTFSGAGAKEIAGRLDLPVSTVYRMLKFLTERGYLQNRGGVYFLGSGLGRLGHLAESQNPLLRRAHPLLSELSAKTMETVHIAELLGSQIIYIDKVDGSRSVRMGSLIGKTAPVYCTGVGKAILAYLPEAEVRTILNGVTFQRFTSKTIPDIPAFLKELKNIRNKGYAVDDCEHEDGVYCVAAPVFDFNRRPIAGISISGAEIYLRDRTELLVGLLRECAGKL